MYRLERAQRVKGSYFAPITVGTAMAIFIPTLVWGKVPESGGTSAIRVLHLRTVYTLYTQTSVREGHRGLEDPYDWFI